MYQSLLNTYERIREILENIQNNNENNNNNNYCCHCCSYPLETHLEIEVKRLFDLADIIFFTEDQPQRDHKKLFYVAYLLRQHDSDYQRVTVKLQFCKTDSDSSNYALYLATWWKFGNASIRLLFDAQGFPEFECVWLTNPSYHMINIWADIDCLGDVETETPQEITKELMDIWEDLLEIDVEELRL